MLRPCTLDIEDVGDDIWFERKTRLVFGIKRGSLGFLRYW